MISNLPVALKASLCHKTCLFLLEAQVKGKGTTPPGEGYWDCRKSERRQIQSDLSKPYTRQATMVTLARSKEKLFVNK